MTTVNIPRSVEDPFYRYTMPSLRIASEGRGQNTRTILSNIHAIADALSRPVTWCMKWLSYQLGIPIASMGGICMLKGQPTLDQLNSALDSFINDFVLCSTCGNPETRIHFKETLSLRCKACGHSTTPPVSKMTRYILNSQQPIKAKDSAPVTQPEVQNYWNDDSQWSVSTDVDTVRKRMAAFRPPTEPSPTELHSESNYIQWVKLIYPQLTVSNEQKTLPTPRLGLDGRSLVWTNFISFCNHIHRDPSHLQSYLNNELGIDCRFGEEALTMKARINQSQLQKLIRKYVSTFVACTECKSLDTVLASHDRLTFRVCNACGSQRSMDKISAGFRTVKRGERRK